jgi:hypothetical protein
MQPSFTPLQETIHFLSLLHVSPAKMNWMTMMPPISTVCWMRKKKTKTYCDPLVQDDLPADQRSEEFNQLSRHLYNLLVNIIKIIARAAKAMVIQGGRVGK